MDDLQLLADQTKIKKERPAEESNTPRDDNDEILEMLKSRLELGKARYGHGVVIDQNTQDLEQKKMIGN